MKLLSHKHTPHSITFCILYISCDHCKYEKRSRDNSLRILFLILFIHSACLVACRTSPVAWAGFFQVSCDQCIITNIRVLPEWTAALTLQCNNNSVLWPGIYSAQTRSTAEEVAVPRLGSVLDQKSAAVKLATCSPAQRAQCAHGFENEVCITVGSYCVSKAPSKCSVSWCSGLLAFQWSYLSYRWFQIIFAVVDIWKQQQQST